MICECFQDNNRAKKFNLQGGDSIYLKIVKKYEFNFCPYCGKEFNIEILEMIIQNYKIYDFNVWENLNYDVTEYTIDNYFYGYRERCNYAIFSFNGWLNYTISSKDKEEAIKKMFIYVKKIKKLGIWGNNNKLHTVDKNIKVYTY